MSLITKARLVGKSDLGRDRFEYDVRFFSADGAEVALGTSGEDVVLTSTDDLEEGSTHLYYTDARVGAVIDGREDLATQSDVATAVGGKADSSAMTTALAAKADASSTTTALAAKADSSAMTTALAAKADSSALSAKADSSSVTAGLATKRDLKNQAKLSLDPTNDFVERFEVVKDGSSSAGWPNRVEYSVTPADGGTGASSRVVTYLNEYFEWRGNARKNTVLWRAFVREFTTDPAHDMATAIWEIQSDRTDRTPIHTMFGQGNFYHLGDGTVGGDLSVGDDLTVTGDVTAATVASSGTVTGTNIGVPIKGVYNTGSEPTGQPTGTIILVRP